MRREGHARVPAGHLEDGLAIGTWVREQRALYRRDLLTLERESILQSLPGWVWRLGPTFPRHRREDLLRLLRAFVKREGHARVPQNHRERGVRLGYWVVRQRRAYARGRLLDREARELERFSGWSWTAHPVHRLSFDEMLRLLRRYAEREGHCLVPQAHAEAGLPLGKWIQGKRRAHAVGSLPSRQRERLEKLPGWQWRIRPVLRRVPLERTLSALRHFVEREGHARVPAQHREGTVALGQWVNGRRVAYKNGRLDPALARRLERFRGWTWDVRQHEFEKMLDLLRRYARREGHTRVPFLHREAGARLGQMVATKRTAYRRGSLSREEVAALEALPAWAWSLAD